MSTPVRPARRAAGQNGCATDGIPRLHTAGSAATFPLPREGDSSRVLVHADSPFLAPHSSPGPLRLAGRPREPPGCSGLRSFPDSFLSGVCQAASVLPGRPAPRRPAVPSVPAPVAPTGHTRPVAPFARAAPAEPAAEFRRRTHRAPPAGAHRPPRSAPAGWPPGRSGDGERGRLRAPPARFGHPRAGQPPGVHDQSMTSPRPVHGHRPCRAGRQPRRRTL